MTLHRKVASAFVVVHLTAISVASLPTQPRIEQQASPRRAPVSRAAEIVDSIGRFLSGSAGVLASAANRTIGVPVRAYISWTGLAQQWAMFSNPPQFDRYWRVRHYVQPAVGQMWMVTELIGPAHREDQVRLARAFRDSYQDKALEVAYDGFLKRRKPSLVRPGTGPSELPDDLAPIARYFARRRSLPGTGALIVRTELWVGDADTKPVGHPVDLEALAVRRAALLEYAEGPLDQRLRVQPFPPYHAVEHAAGIRWTLEYFEQP